MAQKPNYRVVAKSKASGKYQDLAAFWISENGISGQLDRAVEKIVLTNGTVIKPDACWFNLQENKEQAEQQSGGSSSRQSQPAPVDDDDISF
jgi:hypothetical protein